LKDVPGLRLVGTAAHKRQRTLLVLDGFTNDQVGLALNKEGIAVRTGHHCAQPICAGSGWKSTVRPSLAFYNTCSDVQALVNVLPRLRGGVDPRGNTYRLIPDLLGKVLCPVCERIQ